MEKDLSIYYQVEHSFNHQSMSLNMYENSDLLRVLIEDATAHPFRRLALGTHNGEFHADDLLATAALMHALKPYHFDVRIVRSRDVDYLTNQCNLIYDVGGGKYDHHDRCKVLYPNGIPMAACGKILNDLVTDADILEGLRVRLFYAVEAHDNGYTTPDFIESSKLSFVTSFNPTWREPNDNKAMFRRFMRVLPIVQNVYERTIETVSADIVARDFILQNATTILDGRFLILDRYCPFYEYARTHQELLGAVYPRDHQWAIRMSPTFRERYATRASFPESWRGLSREELQKVSGISDAQFCHSAGFIATFSTRAGACAACHAIADTLKNSETKA